MLEQITTLAIWSPGPLELIIIGILGVLIFGKRLPEVGKSVGKGIVEFKKGLSGVEEDLQTSDDDTADQASNRLGQSSTQTHTENPENHTNPAETQPRSTNPSA